MIFLNPFRFISKKSIQKDSLKTRFYDTWKILSGGYNSENDDYTFGPLDFTVWTMLSFLILEYYKKELRYNQELHWAIKAPLFFFVISAAIIYVMDSLIARPLLGLVLTAVVSPLVLITHAGFSLYNTVTEWFRYKKINNLLKPDVAFDAKKFEDCKTYFTSLTNNMIEVELTNSHTQETLRTIKLDPINKDSDRKMLNEIIKLYGQSDHFTAFKKPRNGKVAASEQDKIQGIQRLNSKYKRPA